jgi:hypothetical protein
VIESMVIAQSETNRFPQAKRERNARYCPSILEPLIPYRLTPSQSRNRKLACNPIALHREWDGFDTPGIGRKEKLT